jgi:hypothetical protein
LACGGVKLATAQTLDPEIQAYTTSLFNEPDKVMQEFDALTKAFPLLSAYNVGLFSAKSCGNPEPSKQLYAAAGGDEIMKTKDGQKVFVAMGVASTMKYQTPAAKDAFCQSARSLLDLAEKTVAGRSQ